MNGRRIKLLNVNVDDYNLSDTLKRAEEYLNTDKFHHLITPGPEFLLEASAHPKFQAILNRADLSIPDGIGLKYGAWLAGKRLHNRIPGVEFINGLLHLAAHNQSSVFLFGGAPRVAEQAAQKILQRYPGLKIVGIESGHRGWWQKLANHQIIEKIHLAKPDILLVALGAPKQELWIDQHRAALHQVRIAIGVGRTFDYWAGIIKPPHRLWRRLGLEWLYTFVFAGQFHQPQHRRQRVKRAVWDFLLASWRQRHG